MSAEEKMKNRFLVVVTSRDILNLKIKEEIDFLFPMKEFSVGYQNTFSLEEIKISNAFLFLNRIYDKEGIQKVEELIKNLPKNIKGICFTDLGIVRLVKKYNLNINLIYMQSHNTTNSYSINMYLEYVDSVLLSPDITLKEIKTILDKVTKPLVIPYFSLVDVMYSRRKLITNYQTHFSLEKKNNLILHEPISKEDFLAIENDYGTVIYNKKFIDYCEIKHPNIWYYYINPIGLSKENVIDIINGKEVNEISNSGFLYKETLYKLKEGE